MQDSRYQNTAQPKSPQKSRLTIGLLTYGAAEPLNRIIWSGIADVAEENDVNLICFPGNPVRSARGFEIQGNILYDLVSDPGERENIYTDSGKTGIVRELKFRLEEWFVRYVDPTMDGTHEAVVGNGQIGRPGPAGRTDHTGSHPPRTAHRHAGVRVQHPSPFLSRPPGPAGSGLRL